MLPCLVFNVAREPSHQARDTKSEAIPDHAHHPKKEAAAMSGHAEVCLLWEPLRLAAPIKSFPMMHRRLVMPISTPCVVDRSNPARAMQPSMIASPAGGVRARQRCQGICRKSARPCPNPGLSNPLRSSGLRGRVANIRVPLLLSPRLYQAEPDECPPTDTPPPYLIATATARPAELQQRPKTSLHDLSASKARAPPWEFCQDPL
jgi:hypothetical protein